VLGAGAAGEGRAGVFLRGGGGLLILCLFFLKRRERRERERFLRLAFPQPRERLARIQNTAFSDRDINTTLYFLLVTFWGGGKQQNAEDVTL
jgi:hypothetical protein